MEKKTALLIVDVQIGMFTDPNYPLYNGEELLDTLESLIKKARYEDIPIIYIQHEGGSGDSLDPTTEGFKIHQRIAPLSGDYIISKTRPNAFYKTKLKQTLDELGILQLIICGIQSEMCVDTTCRQASDLDYNVMLVKDGHTTFDSPVLKAADIIKHHNFLLASWAAVIKPEKEIEF
ncbi:MAG: cysteine hydrolase family protein [Promethearchaeota archaeon]